MNKYYYLFLVFSIFSVFFVLKHFGFIADVPIANASYLMTPFRHAKEVVNYQGAPVSRTQVGCQISSSEFIWIDFSKDLVASMRGSHHRKIRLHSVLSGYTDLPTLERSEYIIRNQICVQSEFSQELGCIENTALAGVRRFYLNGEVENQKVWNCGIKE